MEVESKGNTMLVQVVSWLHPVTQPAWEDDEVALPWVKGSLGWPGMQSRSTDRAGILKDNSSRVSRYPRVEHSTEYILLVHVRVVSAAAHMNRGPSKHVHLIFLPLPAVALQHTCHVLAHKGAKAGKLRQR